MRGCFSIYTRITYTKRIQAVFVESHLFEKHRSEYMSDDEYRDFQCGLLMEPAKGDLIQGIGGLRKARESAKGKDKRGCACVIYYYLNKSNRFYLLTIYAKNEMSDLTNAQKKQLENFMEVWKNEQA